jgi:hypothetical protein
MICPIKLKTFNYYKSVLEFSEVTMGRQKCRHDNTISAHSLCYQKSRRKQKRSRDFEKIITSYGRNTFSFADMEEEFRGAAGEGGRA